MAHGDGTKPRLRKDGRWIASFEAGWTERGTRRRRSVTGRTEAECRRKLRDALIQYRSEGLTAVNPKTTIKRWCDTWLADYKLDAKPRVYTTDAGWVARWIVPTIGNRRLSELTSGDIGRVEKSVIAAGRSQTTALNVVRLLKRILRAAVVAGHRVPDPAMSTPLPRAAVSSREAIPATDAARILTAAARKDSWPPLEPLPLGRSAHGKASDWQTLKARRAHRVALDTDVSRWMVALLQGLRQGEALGLLWENVDLDRGSMAVEWELQRIPEGHEIPAHLARRRIEDTNYWLLPPKSAAGRRVVPLVPIVTAALRDWQERCPDPKGLVWPRASGGPMSAHEDSDAWRFLLQVAGVAKVDGSHFVLHEARHTTVSLLLAAKVPPEVIVQIVGHSTFASTQHYAHLDLSAARAALTTMAEQFSATVGTGIEPAGELPPGAT